MAGGRAMHGRRVLARLGVGLAASLIVTGTMMGPALGQSRSNAGTGPVPAATDSMQPPATPSPAVTGSPAPAATPNPRKVPPPSRLYVSGRETIFFGDQQYAGSGVSPPEAASFASGGLGPATPYDFFSGAPTQSGIGSTQDVRIDLSYQTGALVYGARVWAENVQGSAHVDAYWNEPLLSTLNPHMGMRAFTLPIAFTTHAGQDDVTAFRGSLTQGWIGTPGGGDELRVGVFNDDLADRFVYAPPPAPGTLPAVAPVLPASLGDGAPGLSDWRVRRGTTPIVGTELTLHSGLGTLDVARARCRRCRAPGR